MSYFNDDQAERSLPLYDYHEQYLVFNDDEATSSNTRTSIPRDYEDAERCQMEDYFGDNPRYPKRNLKEILGDGSERVQLFLIEATTNNNIESIPEHFLLFRSKKCLKQ